MIYYLITNSPRSTILRGRSCRSLSGATPTRWRGAQTERLFASRALATWRARCGSREATRWTTRQRATATTFLSRLVIVFLLFFGRTEFSTNLIILECVCNDFCVYTQARAKRARRRSSGGPRTARCSSLRARSHGCAKATASR